MTDKLPSNPSATLRALNKHLWPSAALRAATLPASEAAAPKASKWAKGEERKLHDFFSTDLKRRGWPFIHSRMDKPSTIRKGWPDFTILHGGRVVCIEFKTEDGAPDQDQQECIAELQAAGVPVLVAYDLQAAIDFTAKHLANPDQPATWLLAAEV